jgi:hypothetical protein
MASNDLIAWTGTQVKDLLPGLDGEYLTEAVKYSLSLPPEDTDRHWRSLLGSSPQVDSFLQQLKQRRASKPTQTVTPAPQSRLHAPVPLSASNARGLSSAETSRTPSPSKVLRITSKPVQRKSKGPGKLTSDLGKPKQKPPTPAPIAQALSENRPLTELEEIDSALQAITITPKKRVECGCFGTVHDVYPLAPNCLTCGRIICIAEGIGDCFYCGQVLIDEGQREELVRELRVERGVAKTKAANEKVKKVRAGDGRNRVWASKVGGQAERGFDTGDSSDMGSGHATPLDGNAYIEAEKRRDELLEFDRTFAERTKIIGTTTCNGVY